MEITRQMTRSHIDIKAKYCPYCRSLVNTHYGDDRCRCDKCGREYYVLRYEVEK